MLIIAVNTFLILGDKKRAASWVQDHSLLLWLLPWGLSALWAALGLGLIGYGDIGACGYFYDLRKFADIVAYAGNFQGAGLRAMLPVCL